MGIFFCRSSCGRHPPQPKAVAQHPEARGASNRHAQWEQRRNANKESLTGSVSIESTATSRAPTRAHHHQPRRACTHTQTQKHPQRASKPSRQQSNSTHLLCNHERVRLAHQLHHDRGAHGDLLGPGAEHPRPLVLGHVSGGDALDVWSARRRRPIGAREKETQKNRTSQRVSKMQNSVQVSQTRHRKPTRTATKAGQEPSHNAPHPPARHQQRGPQPPQQRTRGDTAETTTKQKATAQSVRRTSDCNIPTRLARLPPHRLDRHSPTARGQPRAARTRPPPSVRTSTPPHQRQRILHASPDGGCRRQQSRLPRGRTVYTYCPSLPPPQARARRPHCRRPRRRGQSRQAARRRHSSPRHSSCRCQRRGGAAAGRRGGGAGGSKGRPVRLGE